MVMDVRKIKCYIIACVKLPIKMYFKIYLGFSFKDYTNYSQIMWSFRKQTLTIHSLSTNFLVA